MGESCAIGIEKNCKRELEEIALVGCSYIQK